MPYTRKGNCVYKETGKKMGKSEGNAVFLDTDPKNMYGINNGSMVGIILVVVFYIAIFT